MTLTSPALALCPPAVRSVVLVAFADEMPDGDCKTSVKTLPVLAVVAKADDDGSIGYDVLVAAPDPAGGIIEAETLALYSECWQLVVCTWGPDQDGDRLADLAATLEMKAARLNSERLERIALHESAGQGARDAVTAS